MLEENQLKVQMIKCVCVSIVRDRGHNFNKLVRVLRTTIFCKKTVPSQWALSNEHQAKRHRRDVIISFLWRPMYAISSIINGMCLEFYDSANTKADHQWAILFRTIFNFVWSPEPILVLEMGFVVWWIKLTHTIFPDEREFSFPLYSNVVEILFFECWS